MSSKRRHRQQSRMGVRPSPVPGHRLGAYEILNAQELAWPANIYKVDFRDQAHQGHDSRGDLKGILFDLKRKAGWTGYGFMVDLNEAEVAVPAAWELAESVTEPGYEVSLFKTVTARASKPSTRSIVRGILKEGIKRHFKDNLDGELGPLWQDYGAFCQRPIGLRQADNLMCRRFSFAIRVLADGTFVFQPIVSTTTVDGRTMAQYYEQGEVGTLCEAIDAKRANRLNRKNRPTQVRVLEENPQTGMARVLELGDIASIIEDAQGHSLQQRSRSHRKVICRQFGGRSYDVPLSSLRLILASQVTREDHAETVIAPHQRMKSMQEIRDFIHGCEVYGFKLDLAEKLVNADRFDHEIVLPPAVYVRGRDGARARLAPPRRASYRDLQQRSRKRLRHIQENGFLVRRPISPMLAWPRRFPTAQGNRLKADLEAIWSEQGIDASFYLIRYDNVAQIRAELEQGDCNTLLAVLPERPHAPRSGSDTHSQLKRNLDVPSQCIHYQNTLPKAWIGKSWAELQRINGAGSGRARRIHQRYGLCLGNLLVKHHCFPFAPAEAFEYNVHVGLDVGGVHNTHAVACLGYGFHDPDAVLFFLPQEIPINVQQKEPIPTDCLFDGLLELFERIKSELDQVNLPANLNSVLFHRDGSLLGAGDSWNERDALKRLFEEIRQRGWVDRDAVWTAVEVLKTAEHWRIFGQSGPEIRNPMVGYAVFPFEDHREAVVATTGEPYLTQGTSLPLMLRISDIAGLSDRDRVVRDVVWQADLCFTKPDMGMRLPWVLNVADSGALQLSNSYQISGITA